MKLVVNKQIAWSKVHSYLDEGYQLIDIRHPEEFVELPMLKKAKNIVMENIIANPERYFKNKDEKIILVCFSGIRSNDLRIFLIEHGYANVVDIAGGMGIHR